MSLWSRFFPRRRIGIRLVAAVTLAMTVVLACAGTFVYLRVEYALNSQLDVDLKAYSEVAERAVTSPDGALPTDTPGQSVQVYDVNGTLLRTSNDTVPRIATRADVRRALNGHDVDLNTGRLLPPREPAYRASVFVASGSKGTIVVAAIINRAHHDEALRELMLQLVLSDLLALVATGFVGYGVVRAALGPVEEYRRAVVAAGDDDAWRLPVAERDDELTRLGRTFNLLLERIESGHERERGFLADASHELRSPLALLAAEIEWAMHRPRSSAEMSTVLASLKAQVDRLVGLSNDLLDLEELRGEAQPHDVVPADELVEAALAGHREHAASLGRGLEVRVPPDRVRVDRLWATVAISNLVANALKHGTGRVSVDASVSGQHLRVSVTDEGPGIPLSLGERAFDRFTRADESRTTRGNGLGLALVRAVAEEHGGRASLVPGGVLLELG